MQPWHICVFDIRGGNRAADCPVKAWKLHFPRLQEYGLNVARQSNPHQADFMHGRSNSEGPSPSSSLRVQSRVPLGVGFFHNGQLQKPWQ